MTGYQYRVLVTGAGGQIGRALAMANWPQPLSPRFVTRAELDITDALGVEAELATCQPDLIINAAAYTDVAAAEGDAEAAYVANATAPAHLAELAARQGIGLIHISTDFVFSGPGPHTEEGRPTPLNVYGASKLAGEQAVQLAHPAALIVRTAWVFDADGNNFVTKLLSRADQAELSVVDDEIGCPSSAADVAEGLIQLALRLQSGPAPEHHIYHLTNQGETSRYQMAQALFDRWASHGHHRPVLTPVSSHHFASVVARPSDSRLASSRFKAVTGWTPPHWREALNRVVDQIATGEA